MKTHESPILNIISQALIMFSTFITGLLDIGHFFPFVFEQKTKCIPGILRIFFALVLLDHSLLNTVVINFLFFSI